MMHFLHDIPHWLLGASIVGAMTGVTLAGYVVFHRLFPGTATEDNKSVAMSVLGVIATINSLLLAFSAVSVWEAYSNAEEAVVVEGNTVGELARDLAVFDTPESRAVRVMLRQYADMVVRHEWAAMRQGRADLDTWNHFDRMFLAAGAIKADTLSREIVLSEIWARLNELLQERRSRLYTSTSGVPVTLWAVVLISTAITMLTAYVLPKSTFNVAMIGMLGLSMGLVFFFIIAMDRPYSGKESIGPQAFETAIQNMDRWDNVIAPR